MRYCLGIAPKPCDCSEWTTCCEYKARNKESQGCIESLAQTTKGEILQTRKMVCN